MIKTNINKIKEHISGDRAFANVKEIINFHRVQASPGYRAAANFCLNYLQNEKINSHIETFKAQVGVKYWQQNMFKEWECKDAYLDLQGEKEIRLADFKANAMSIIQRSLNADYRDNPLDIVSLEKGSDEELYKDVDLKGKIIFINDDYTKYIDWAVYKKGAVGIITDYMPEMNPIRYRNDLYDATNNVSFHWGNEPSDVNIFGFVLTPRLGDMLRTVCTNQRKDYENKLTDNPYPKAKVYVDSRLYDGQIEDVIAQIDGQTDEVVLVSAHLCHPRACANDNASGVAAAMEAIKTINDLIKEGKLEKPRRTIKVILIPEFTGVYAYLSSLGEDLSKIKAAINLDMVGGMQEKIFGPLIVMSQPDACPSFVRDMALLILDEIKKEFKTIALNEYVSTFVSTDVKFSSGSDHSVFSDPTVGIPCIALTQWPDKTYHTSQDTLDKIDPKMLARSSAICASYLYTAANLSVADMCEIMIKSKHVYMKTLGEIAKKYSIGEYTEKHTIDKLEYTFNLYRNVCNDYKRFFDEDEIEKVEKIISKEIDYLDNLTKNYIELLDLNIKDKSTENIEEKYLVVPKRLFKGPLIATRFEKYLSFDAKEKYNALKNNYPSCGSMDISIGYLCDGKRSIYEITDQISMEKDKYNLEYVFEYLKFLNDIGLVKL